jgi:MFS family permease
MGYLADKVGQVKMIVIGQVVFVAALSFAGFGQDDRWLVTIGLTLLGLGWSASTVAGSSLLSASLPANEKTNVQGVSDSMMNLSGATGGAVAGSILGAFAFAGLNLLAVIPVLTISLLTVVFGRRTNGSAKVRAK